MKKFLLIFLMFASAGAFAQSADTTLTAAASDADGTIASYTWSQVSGPACKIVSPNLAATHVTFTIAGNYTFQVTVRDNDGAIATATKDVTVYAANMPPTVTITPAGVIQLQLK